MAVTKAKTVRRRWRIR